MDLIQASWMLTLTTPGGWDGYLHRLSWSLYSQLLFSYFCISVPYSCIFINGTGTVKAVQSFVTKNHENMYRFSDLSFFLV